jgi:protoheme IX farnesyltransferase
MDSQDKQLTAGMGDAGDVPEIGLISDLVTLTKARLSFLVILTTLVGFCMASPAGLKWSLLFHAIFGTTLAAAAAAVLNQWTESHVDRLMERTRQRPLPAGRMEPGFALWFGIGLGLTGVAWLAVMANMLSALLAAATVLIYLFLYTPLKRRTAYCTLVGAVSGAIPPVIGWTAAQGVSPTVGLGAWVLFGVLFTWQMPHFLAIAWIYRDEYAQAGFVMLKREDAGGLWTSVVSLLFAVMLALICLVPYFWGLNSSLYIFGALALNGALLFLASRFLIERSTTTARRLFFGSIVFLPLLLGLMVLTKR